MRYPRRELGGCWGWREGVGLWEYPYREGREEVWVFCEGVRGGVGDKDSGGEGGRRKGEGMLGLEVFLMDMIFFYRLSIHPLIFFPRLCLHATP